MLKLLCLCSHILLKTNCPRCVEAFINCLVSLVQKPLIGSFFVCFRFCSIGQKSSKCNTFLGKIDVWVWSKEKNKRDKVWQMKSFSLIAVYPYNHWGNNPQLCLSSPSRMISVLVLVMLLSHIQKNLLLFFDLQVWMKLCFKNRRIEVFNWNHIILESG